MAQKPPKGGSARGVTNERLQVKVGIDISDIYTRLQNRTAELLPDAQQMGLTGEELADYVISRLADLSEKPIEAAGRAATSEAFNLGRNLEVQSRLTDVAQAVRSAIFDENTCENCIALDGTVVEVNGPIVSISPEGRKILEDNGIDPDSPDAYFAIMPPNFCNGEDFCRDLLIYRAEAA